MTTDGLREQVEDFAEQVNATLRSVLGDLVEPLEATDLGASRFVVETAADEGLTLTKGGPLIRYEYSQNAHRHRPIAHIHVHTDDERMLDVVAAAGDGTRTGNKRARDAANGKAQHADLHLPVGGPRFRPALEDVLHMAVEEFGCDSQPGWIQYLEEGREDWRRIQTKAVARDAPEEAAEALRSIGYTVTPPDGPTPGDTLHRLRKF